MCGEGSDIGDDSGEEGGYERGLIECGNHVGTSSAFHKISRCRYTTEEIRGIGKSE